MFFRKFKKKKKLIALTDVQREAFFEFAHEIEKIHKKDYSSFERLLWDLYPQFIRIGVAGSFFQNPDYIRKGYAQGSISKTHNDTFLTLLKEAQTRPITHDDYDRDYVTHPDLRPYEAVLNQSHKLFVWNEALLKALKPILEELKGPIADCLGSPWRIINVLCWETFPEAADSGPNDWHRDGLPFAVNKVMVYLTGASQEGGTTTLQFEDGTHYQAEGPAGTWMLFKISEILHKGEKPQKGSRIVLEIRVIPSFTFDLRPYCAGFNAHYPKSPWYQPLNRDCS